MEVAISVVLVVAFIGFIAWRMKKSKNESAANSQGTGGGGGSPIGENVDMHQK